MRARSARWLPQERLRRKKKLFSSWRSARILEVESCLRIVGEGITGRRREQSALCGRRTSRARGGAFAMIGGQIKRVRWFLVFWLFILSAVSYLDRVNFSIAGGAIADSYHLSNVQLGKVFSAMLVGYALFQTVGGRLADLFGSRRVLAAGVVWWGIFTGLTALVPPGIAGALVLFVAVRFLLGAGEAVIYPAANQFVARWIPTRERGIANGWIFAGVGAGAGLTPPLITYLMTHYGWRSAFWVCAVIGFLAGIVWFISCRDKPDDSSKKSDDCTNPECRAPAIVGHQVSDERRCKARACSNAGKNPAIGDSAFARRNPSRYELIGGRINHRLARAKQESHSDEQHERSRDARRNECREPSENAPPHDARGEHATRAEEVG